MYGVVSVLEMGFSSCGCSGVACGVGGSGVLYSGISDFGEAICAFDVPFLRNIS